MIYAINYADITYRKAQLYNSQTAVNKGKVDQVLEYGPEKLDESFLKKNEASFTVGDPRIGKYGLWRPWILLDALNQMQEDDYLIYCDSGAYYVNSVMHLIKLMERENLDLLCFELEHQEKKYTKRDVFRYFECDTEEYTGSGQRCSGYIVLRKSARTEEFVQDFYQISIQASFLFTDEPNRLGWDNYEEFIDHRHNQSVFSLLTKKYGYPAFRSPDQWGEPTGFLKRGYFYFQNRKKADFFPMILVSHRTGYLGNRVKLKVFISYEFPRLYLILYKYNVLYPIRDFLVYVKHRYIVKDR